MQSMQKINHKKVLKNARPSAKSPRRRFRTDGFRPVPNPGFASRGGQSRRSERKEVERRVKIGAVGRPFVVVNVAALVFIHGMKSLFCRLLVFFFQDFAVPVCVRFSNQLVRVNLIVGLNLFFRQNAVAILVQFVKGLGSRIQVLLARDFALFLSAF